jgi:hypothetical protein
MRNVAITVLMLLLLSGCRNVEAERQVLKRQLDQFKQIEVGMKRSQVTTLLGQPYHTSKEELLFKTDRFGDCDYMLKVGLSADGTVTNSLLLHQMLKRKYWRRWAW